MRIYVYNLLKIIRNIRDIKINYSWEYKCCTFLWWKSKTELLYNNINGTADNCILFKNNIKLRTGQMSVGFHFIL
jgi:hypothetical protein